MPSPVGFSRYTEEKQQILGAVCERLFSIEKRIFDDPSKLDVEENLLAVCRPCHAAIHGKDR